MSAGTVGDIGGFAWVTKHVPVAVWNLEIIWKLTTPCLHRVAGLVDAEKFPLYM